MAIPQADNQRSAEPKKRRRRKRRHVWKDKHWRWVARRAGRLAGPGLRLQAPPQTEARTTSAAPARSPPSAGAAAAAPAPVERDPRPAGAYQGAVRRRAQAMRLLNRAGFGPVPGQAEQLASLGLVGAVQSLTRPSGAAILSGPAPVDDDGNPIAPADAWGHDHLWWLDRMVRTNQPLVERMALVFHDWFATSHRQRLHNSSR